MDKKQAQEYIKSVFQFAFSPQTFIRFMGDLLNEFEPKADEYRGNLVREDYRDHIVQYRRIGKYTDPDGLTLDILVVETRSLAKLDRARTTLRNFVVRHLKKFKKDYAIVAFYSKEDGGADWRFSFVKIELDTVRTESGKRKVEEDITPAKRYSYLVGEHENSYTVQKQLLPVLTNDYSNPTVEDLEQAFSIEKVTDEFFDQYKELYLKLSENQALRQALDAEGLDGNRFAKKLLGQIVFLYFLQKKGWLGVAKTETWGKGDKWFMQTLFEQANQAGQNFFGDSLQYLFYEALAKDRRGTVDPAYYPRFNCKIPFLNGGLFEADYDWERLNLTIPNDLFRNKEKNKAGDTGTGILDVFDRYNFTIKEDEPLEKEVAVDPEMLGKVFENLLDITHRKSKGAFYTPREIVHYMCQESLIHYLDNVLNDYGNTHQALGTDQTDLFGNKHRKGQLALMEQEPTVRVPKDDLETFIRRGFLAIENDLTVENKGRETATYSFKLPESVRQNAQVIDNHLRDIKICDPAIGSGAFPVGLLHEIVTARLVLKTFLPNATNHTPYKLKRHAIQESIYGVDIEASAIDIARLRLWLSLIVDEDDFYEIETLPNLDYKIVQGNSLIGLPKGYEPQWLDVIEAKKEIFFNCTDRIEKTQLKEEIDKKIKNFLMLSERALGYSVDFDYKLFFSEVWKEKDGFDVIVANPPYVDIKQLPNELVRFLFTHYNTTENRINLYSIFLEKAWLELNAKGFIAFINPNSILQNSSYRKIRNLLISGISKIVKLPDNVFKQVIVETILLFYSKYNQSSEIKGAFYKSNEVIDFDKIKFSTFSRASWNKDPSYQYNIYIGTNLQSLFTRLESECSNLSNHFDISLGITPYDTYRGHSQEIIKGRQFHAKQKINQEYVPLISGSNVLRYTVLSEPIDEYLHYGDWLGAPRQQKFFLVPRVIVRQIISGNPGRIFAGFTTEELYHTQIGFSIISKQNNLNQVLVLTALLCSDVITAYHKYKYLDIEKKTFQKILIENCKKFPIPVDFNSISSTIRPLIFYYKELVNENKLNKLATAYFDNIIKALVFELYFPTELKAAGKEVARHLDNLRPLTETMSVEEKLAVISQEFTRLYDPAHPVRNALETMDSVEEVRIIKAAVR